MKNNTSPTQKALNIWAIILILWSLYRYKFALPVWFDEFIAKPILFILPVYFYITTYEHKDFFKAIWIDKKKTIQDVGLGIGIGILCIATAALALYYRNHALPQISLNFGNFFYFLVIAIATGISEEILSRGFVLKKLYEDSHNMITSSLTSSVLFFILHIPVLLTMSNITGNALPLLMATSFLLSLSNSFIYLTRRSLVLPILINAFYNLAILLYS
jgi:membrane protease YdiL (CAAX protease family)